MELLEKQHRDAPTHLMHHSLDAAPLRDAGGIDLDVSAVFFHDVFPLIFCHTFLNNVLFFRRGVPAVAQARMYTLAHL